MELLLLKLDVGQDHEDDRISALPDHLLLDILERLDLTDAVRSGAVSTLWRHLPHQLTRLHLGYTDFRGNAQRGIMDAFTGAVQRLMAGCDCTSNRAIKTLVLAFYMSGPHLSSIGGAVEDVVSRGETRYLEFHIHSSYYSITVQDLSEWGQQFMSFSRAYPVAFRWLTKLTLAQLAFGDTDVADVIMACDKLEHLSLKYCMLTEHSALKIDTPCSRLHVLEFLRFSCTWIELVYLPKLRRMACEAWNSENAHVRFGYVPELCDVSLDAHAMAWQCWKYEHFFD